MIQSILESRDQTGYTYFWPCPPKIFLIKLYCMWINMNMQKIRLFYWFVFKIWLIKKFCNLIGWEHFNPYFRTKSFPKHGICVGTQQILKVFIIEQIQLKLMTKCFYKFKKPCFWSIWQILGAKHFSGKSGSDTHNFIRFSSTMPKFRKKANDTVPRKCPDRQKDRRTEWQKDGQTLFNRTLSATAYGSIKF